jgi:hypothetical protein
MLLNSLTNGREEAATALRGSSRHIGEAEVPYLRDVLEIPIIQAILARATYLIALATLESGVSSYLRCTWRPTVWPTNYPNKLSAALVCRPGLFSRALAVHGL